MTQFDNGLGLGRQDSSLGDSYDAHHQRFCGWLGW